MSEIETNGNHDDLQTRRSLSEGRNSITSSIKRSISEDYVSPLMVDDEDEVSGEIKHITKINQPRQISKAKSTNKLSLSTLVFKNDKSSTLKLNSSLNTR
jgi:hypothetical protein